MRTCTITLSSLCLATAMLATTIPNAAAGIIGVGGDVGGPWTGNPGNNTLELNKNEHNTGTQVFIERTNERLQNSVKYNAHKVFRYLSNSDLVSHTLPGNNRYTVNSYIFHFDPTSGFPPRKSEGYVDFRNKIYVISKNDDLNGSDAQLGMPGVTYPSGLIPDRGYDLFGSDEFTISNPSPNVWRLAFEAHASTGMDQLRVVEVVSQVPEPTTLGSLLLGCLTLGLRRRRSILS